MSSDIKPFIILSEGRVVSLLQTNAKGYKKSIENNQIWAVTPETQRLLPDDTLGKAGSFRETALWYEAAVQPEADRGSGASAAPTKADAPAVNAIGADSSIIERLSAIIEQRKTELPEGSYTTHLFNSGISKIKKKTGEEAIELLLAEDRDEIIYEAADLIYHMLVLISASDIKPAEIFKELEKRE